MNNVYVINFIFTFYGCGGLTGDAPELWNSYIDNIYSTGCFGNLTNLGNYNSIPDDWK